MWRILSVFYLIYYISAIYLYTHIIHFRVTKRKLYVRVKKSKSTMEKLYLNFEIVKCNIQIGPECLIEARNISAKCYQWAHEINSHTWITNILIVSGIIEFRMDSITKCCNMINKALEITEKLQMPGVIKFLEKVSCT